jgi:N-acyl-D-amino-acid deacylase
MRKLFLLFILLPFFSFAQWKNKIATVDSVLTYLYERQLFNGVVVLGEKGKVIYKKSFGIAGTEGKPLTTSSAFNLASVSKQFFTMMTMILQEQGKLRYDDAVQKYLPSFPYPQITLRNLMNHTSGLPEYFDIAEKNLGVLDTLDNESMLSLLAAKKPALVFETGTQFEYCNTNYTTLASVIAAVSGMSCDKFFEERIVKPLKLKNTFIYNIKMKSFPASRVFGFHYEGGRAVPDDLLRVDGIVGDGNVYSSAEDLYKWDQALYTEKLVKKETFLEAITPAKLNNDSLSAYGFGWFIEKQGVEVAHSGGWVAFGTYIDRFIASNQTYILLDNSANYFARGIIKDILEARPFTLPQTQLIANIQLMDGTGVSPVNSAVRIVDKRIRDVGSLTAYPGETVIDGNGNVLAPGFIDAHSHHEWGLNENPEAVAMTN